MEPEQQKSRNSEAGREKRNRFCPTFESELCKYRESSKGNSTESGQS